MNMNKITKTVTIFIGGKERKMRFNINSIVELERRLPEKNIFKTMAGGLFSMDVMTSAVWVGLKYEDKFLDLKKVTTWVNEYLQKNSYQKLYALVYGAIGLSGMFGNASLFEDVINNANEIDEDEEVSENTEKN